MQLERAVFRALDKGRVLREFAQFVDDGSVVECRAQIVGTGLRNRSAGKERPEHAPIDAGEHFIGQIVAEFSKRDVVEALEQLLDPPLAREAQQKEDGHRPTLRDLDNPLDRALVVDEGGEDLPDIAGVKGQIGST